MEITTEIVEYTTYLTDKTGPHNVMTAAMTYMGAPDLGAIVNENSPNGLVKSLSLQAGHSG